MNRCEMCMQQDAIGMTPLHAAVMSASPAALDVVCVLLEANPLAAGVYDMDGLLPLDLACRNPARGSSSLVKVWVVLPFLLSECMLKSTHCPVDLKNVRQYPNLFIFRPFYVRTHGRQSWTSPSTRT